MKKNENNDPIKNKVKITEKIALYFRKKWIVSSTITVLLILILVTAYIALNLWITELDLPEIDVTQNKIYTLSEDSKNAIKDINKEITVYVYGFDDDSTVVNLLQQYSNTNNNIKIEKLSNETNAELMQEYQLNSSYYNQAIIVVSGETQKFIDPTNDFYSYDTTTYEQVDITEQTITNAFLSLSDENKPKIYFLEGHGEMTLTNGLQLLSVNLSNEFYETASLNLLTSGAVPEDCDILSINSPAKDFLESEVTAIKDYINKGGDIFFTKDTLSQNQDMPNLQSILDEYGVSVDNGYILEHSKNYYFVDSNNNSTPIIFRPQLSSSNEITSELSLEGASLWLVGSGRLSFKDDATLQNLNVTKDVIMTSSEQDTAKGLEGSSFSTDLSQGLNQAELTATPGASDIAAVLTKTISDDNKSVLLISATGSFISDNVAQGVSQYPLYMLSSNGDFAIKSMAYLADKDYTLTIRKNMNTTSYAYVATQSQNSIVMMIIFLGPIAIILLGVIIGIIRKRRK